MKTTVVNRLDPEDVIPIISIRFWARSSTSGTKKLTLRNVKTGDKYTKEYIISNAGWEEMFRIYFPVTNVKAIDDFELIWDDVIAKTVNINLELIVPSHMCYVNPR